MPTAHREREGVRGLATHAAQYAIAIAPYVNAQGIGDSLLPGTGPANVGGNSDSVLHRMKHSTIAGAH